MQTEYIRHKLYKSVILLVLLCIITCIFNYEFLPDYSSWISANASQSVHKIYTFSLLISSILLLIGILSTIVFVIFVFVKRKINFIALLGIFLGLYGLINGFILPNKLADRAAVRAIENAEPIILSLNDYALKNGCLPDSLFQLIPNYLKVIPKPGTNGVQNYQYKRKGLQYELRFQVRDLLFNYYIYIYTSNGTIMDKHEAKLVQKLLKPNWYKYWFD